MRSNISFSKYIYIYIAQSSNMISEDQKSTSHRFYRSKHRCTTKDIKKTGGNQMSFHPMGY